MLASNPKCKLIAIGGEWETHGLPASGRVSAGAQTEPSSNNRGQQKLRRVLIRDRHFTAAYQVAGSSSK